MAKLLGRRPCHPLIHHGSQSCLRISQMLREQRSALFRLSIGQKLVDPAVNGNQARRIVMPEIDENHSHPQFAEKFFVKRLQSPVAVKADQQCVKVQIKADGPHPINALHSFLVAWRSR
jgi:hypothetical protein